MSVPRRKDQGNEAAARLAQVMSKGQSSSPDDKPAKKAVPTVAARPQSKGTSPRSRPEDKPANKAVPTVAARPQSKGTFPRSRPDTKSIPTPKPKPRTLSSSDGITSTQPVGLTITKTQAEDNHSLLAYTLSKHTIPISIRLTKDFVTKGSPIALKNGEILLLCFVVEVPTVFASYEGGREQMRLPLYGMQRYERLPDDPLLDDKIYNGTKALIEASPLPSKVRIEDAMLYLADPKASQKSGDLITITRIETRIHTERGTEKFIVGRDQAGTEVRFPEAMHESSYTTMLSPDLVPMSELVKHDMPQRVRLRDHNTKPDESKKPKQQDEVLKLHRFYNEYHVIASRSRGENNTLISIPIDTKIEFEVVNLPMMDVGTLLPAIFSRANITRSVTDVTQPSLPSGLQAVPQPAGKVFAEWAQSYEGIDKMNENYQLSIDEMKEVKANKEQELKHLRKKLEYHIHAVSKPSVPHRTRHSSVPGPPPPIPPRELSKSFDLGMSGSPEGERSSQEDKTQIAELKKKISEKEKFITNLDRTSKQQHESLENVRKDRDALKESQTKHRAEIVRLRTLYEQLHAQEERRAKSSSYSEIMLTKEMSTRGVSIFLRSSNLQQYCRAFEQENIDGLMLFEIDEGIMIEDLGMRKLDARRLSAQISKMR